MVYNGINVLFTLKQTGCHTANCKIKKKEVNPVIEISFLLQLFKMYDRTIYHSQNKDVCYLPCSIPVHGSQMTISTNPNWRKCRIWMRQKLWSLVLKHRSTAPPSPLPALYVADKRVFKICFLTEQFKLLISRYGFIVTMSVLQTEITWYIL